MKEFRKVTVLSIGLDKPPLNELTDKFCDENNLLLTQADQSVKEQIPATANVSPAARPVGIPDVVLIHTSGLTAALHITVNEMKGVYPSAKFIAINEKTFSKKQAESFGLFTSLYCPNINSERQMAEFEKRLLLAIRNARLATYVSSLGFSGKWVMLPESGNAIILNKAAAAAQQTCDVIAIGASAGGTYAIADVLSGLPKDLPCIAIVQHMPAAFIDMFAESLSKVASGTVKVAADKDPVQAGVIYIAPGDMQMTVEKGLFGYQIHVYEGEKYSGHRPSVNVLFNSVARNVGANAIGVILTGMGSDGADGLLAMHKAGAFTIGQDKASSAVYGMPEVAYRKGAVRTQLPLSCIADEIVNRVNKPI